MRENLRPYAKWIAKGFAFDDTVAVDAALFGFCAAKPMSADLAKLESAIRVARLVRTPAQEVALRKRSQ